MVNDIYGMPSIKDEEHERRGQKPLSGGKKYPKPSDEFLTPTELTAFLSNPECKKHLQSLVKECAIQRRRNQQVIYCEALVCTDLASNKELPHLSLNHAEADTMLCAINSIIRKITDNWTL